jgi:bacterial/archaeal transporter family-2 protein
MPQAILIPVLLVLLAGAMTAAQPPTNAILARESGSALFAALLSFAVGTLALLAAVLATQPKLTLGPIRDVPWYAWLGGFYGAFFVTVSAFAAPRLGVASLITIGIAGQLLAALAIDHTGAFGIPRAEISPGRILGVLLVIAGVVLVRRF